MEQRIKNFREFNESILNESFLWPQWPIFFNWLKALFSKSEEKSPSKTPLKNKEKTAPDYLTGQHMLYIPHQQGSYGARVIYLAARGMGEMTPDLKYKLSQNVPTDSEYYNIIKNPKSSTQESAIAFLKYYSESWGKIKKEALQLISKPEFKKIKDAIDSIENPSLPKEFLYTVAFKESSLRENPGTKKYVGLYQIGPMAWAELKRINPSKYKGNVIPRDLKKNAQAGHDYLAHTYNQFKKKIEPLQ